MIENLRWTGVLVIGPPLPPQTPRIWEPGDSPFGTVPRCWAEMAHSPVGEFCSGGCADWWFERAKLTPADHLVCKDPHAHEEHLWGAVEHGTRWLYCAGRGACPPNPEVDLWVRGMVAEDTGELLLGGVPLTPPQCTALFALLDLVRSGWRKLLPPHPRAHGYTPHGWPCCDRCPSGPRPELRARCMGAPGCGLCSAAVGAIHWGDSPRERGEP